MLPRITTLAALLAAGCGEAPAPASDPAYPRDDVLALQHVQAVGTHNSYHVETPGLGLEHLAFSHAPLDVQLGEQGVRQFELDLWWLEDELRVVHDPLFDLGTSCRTFTECLGVIGAWSADHPGHHPLLVLVELKTPFWEPSAAAILDAVDAGVRAVWPDDGVITPAEVQGEHGSLREAMAERGWPPLAELRGRTLLVLLSGATG